MEKASTVKKLSKPILLFLLINSILGSSLFYLPSLGVISFGVASVFSWILIFLIAGFLMLYIGELVTLHPTSGGTYEFCKRAYGRFGSFIGGWVIWIAGNLGMALNVVAASEYFIPEQTTAAFYLRMGFVFFWVIILQFMAYRGIDAGVTMLSAFGIFATITVLLMIIPSFISIPSLFSGTFLVPFKFSFFEPLFRESGVSILAHLGLSLLLISEAFFGFEIVSYVANEAKEPKKLHKILFLGILICGVIMTLYIFSSIGTVPYHDYVTNARPFAVQALNTMGQTGQDIVVFGMYLVIIGAAAAWPITGARLIHAMAKDKLFIEHFGVLHPKHKSPHRAVIFQTVITILFSFFVFEGYLKQWGDSYRTFYLVYVLLSFLALILILFTVPILRRKEKDFNRPFKAPFPIFGPVAFLIFFIVLLVNWYFLEGGVAIAIIQMAFSFLFFSLPFYFLVEMMYNKNAIVNVNEKLAYFSYVFDRISFPFSIGKKLSHMLGSLNGKTILQYGCSTGNLTKELAELVGSNGRIYAIDFAKHKVSFTDNKTKELQNVTVHHHPSLEEFNFVPDKMFDFVYSVGMLSYMQNPEAILKQLSKYVKEDGKIVFVDYDNFFYFIPNVKWIEDDEMLKNLFRGAGFEVLIERRSSIFWQHIIIKGIKI